MKTFSIFKCLVVLIATNLLASCSTGEYDEFPSTAKDQTKPELIANTDSFESDLGEIIPLYIDPNTIPSKISTFSWKSDYVLSDNLWVISGLPITLRSRGGSQYYFSTNGKDKELTLSPTANSTQQRFYVQAYAPSTGIKYRIYSVQTATPLCIGSYASKPDEMILYAPATDPSISSSAWDIYAANYPGYAVIESRFYIAQGPGGIWDIYWNVLQINGSKIGYGRYIGNAVQEFQITPVNTFTLESIQYVDEYEAVVTDRGVESMQSAYTNERYSSFAYDLAFSKAVTETSSYTEEKGVNFNITGLTKLFKRPSVIQGKIDLLPSVNVVADASYTGSNQNIRRTIEKILPMMVPPRTKLIVTYKYKIYDLAVNYEATIVYSGRAAKLIGVWKGRVFVDENLDIEIEQINLDTGEVRSLNLNVADVTSSNRLTL